MDQTLRDQEAARSRRTYMLLAAVALLLIIPLVIAAYLRMSDTTKSGTPGANTSIFEKREGREPLQPSPLATAAPIPKQDSLVRPVGAAFAQEASTEPAPSSLGMITGVPVPAPKQVPPPPQAQPQDQPEPETDLSAVMPKAVPSKPQAQGKRSWAPPRLGTKQTGLRPVSWSTDNRKGAGGAGTTAPQPPAGGQGGMPPGMDPAAMMKNVMPGMDMSKLLQGVGAPGTTNPAAGTTNP